MNFTELKEEKRKEMLENEKDFLLLDLTANVYNLTNNILNNQSERIPKLTRQAIDSLNKLIDYLNKESKDINKPYTEIRKIFFENKIIFLDSGSADENVGKQVLIEISDEQDSGQGAILYFDIDKEGKEKFICQE